jgi:hypothetical protein
MLPSLTHAFIKDGVALTDLSPFDKGVQTINVYTTPNHKNFGDLVKNFFFRPLMAAKAKKAIVDSLKQYHDDDGIADLINEIKKSSLLEGVNYSALKIRLANACLNGLRLGEECPDFLRNIADEGVSNYFADEEKIYENVHFLNGIGTINYRKRSGKLLQKSRKSDERYKNFY